MRTLLTTGFSRAILCPPYLWQTYPQFETLDESLKFVNGFNHAILFIFQNDGTLSWKINKSSLAHIEFKKKIGKQLKGTEAGQSREVTKITNMYSNIFRKKGYESFGLIQGHCDLCAHKCPNRDNPPCRHNGLPSLESAYIDVYKLLENLNIHYEYPVINLLTSVSMILVKKEK